MIEWDNPKYDLKELEVDFVTEAECNMCLPEDIKKAIWVAIFKENEVLVVFQLCTQCAYDLDFNARLRPEIFTDVSIYDKEKVRNDVFIVPDVSSTSSISPPTR